MRAHPIAVRTLCLVWFASWLWTTAAAGEPLRAGAARVDITPERPVRLAGYSSRTNLSRGVHDPLSARAVAFEQAGQRLVLVSTDVLGFYGDTAGLMRTTVLDACGLKPSELFLSAIHSHSAPTVTFGGEGAHPNNVEYSKRLAPKLVEVARTALAQLQPVRLSAGSGASPVGANRRERLRDDDGKVRIVLGRDPSVSTDREVQVLRLVRREGNELLAVVFGYATHSTSLGPGNLVVSGDVHGLAEQFVEKQLGAAIVAAGFAGASGDIDPWYRVLPEFKSTNGWIPEPVLLGSLLGVEVTRVQGRLTPQANSGRVRTVLKVIQLPVKPRSANQPGEANDHAGFTVTAGAVGDVGFVGLGGEVFNEIGRRIKDASPFAHTFVFTHCNGAAGYLPTTASYDAGGYEVQSSRFAPGADERLIEEVLRMLRSIL